MSEIIEHRDQRRGLRGLRLALATPSRRWWTLVTVLNGALFGPLITAATPSQDRTFTGVCGPVQLLMTITVPFLGVLLTAGARGEGRATLLPAVRTALALAAGFAVLGSTSCAVTLTLFASTAPDGPWRHAPAAVLGGVAVQLVDQMLGIGFGLLIGRPVVASAATFSPLGIWALLGVVDAVRPARDWLTPYATAQLLVSGAATAQVWWHELVVVVVWGVGFWLAGAWRLLFRHVPDSAHP